MNIILSIHPKWAKLIYEGKRKDSITKRITRPCVPDKYRTLAPEVFLTN